MTKISLHDTLNFLSKLTLRRIWNFARVLSSFYWSKWTRHAVQWGMPVTISIEPTTACNLRCPECPSGLRAFTRKTGNLKEDFFRKTIEELHRDLSCLIFYFQGEPYINPNFLDMVAFAHRKKIYTITSTNGHFLDHDNARKTVESGLDRLIISVDGASQETYEQYRINGNLSTVLDGARNIVHWKKTLKSRSPHIVFQFLVVRPNEHEIPEIYRLAKEIGVNEVKLKTAQVYDYEHGNPLIPSIDKFARYRKMPGGEWQLKHALDPHCWKLWHASVITWDGMVVPCCFDKDAQHRLGNLKTTAFRAIWQSLAYYDFRRAILRGRNQIDICKNCSEGCSVWV
ncbi:MAG: radical SAM/SPASM domain-containing protein [Saprospiraceae bacterium]